MDAQHRKIIKNNRAILEENISLCKILSYLQEYKMFNKYMWKDIGSMSDLLDLLPTRGPNAFDNFIEILRRANYEKEADILESPSFALAVNSTMCYQMSSFPLGCCLIVNNVDFGDPEKDRHGSDVDAQSLSGFFDEIGFHVTVKSNMKTGEMEKCIRSFSEEDFTKVDCMVLIVLSHGSQKDNKDYVCGTDEKFIFKKAIINMFNNKDCDSLARKPKIFFFIACRGNTNDYGVLHSSSKESVDSVVANIVLPTLSDIFIVHSTLPDQVSIRDHFKGSYFCEALISVLKDKHKSLDLETIIQLVNQKLEGKVSEEYRIVQAAHTEHIGLKKKIMLCHRY